MAKLKESRPLFLLDVVASGFHDALFSFDQLADRGLMDEREIGFHVRTPRPPIDVGRKDGR